MSDSLAHSVKKTDLIDASASKIIVLFVKLIPKQLKNDNNNNWIIYQYENLLLYINSVELGGLSKNLDL